MSTRSKYSNHQYEGKKTVESNYTDHKTNWIACSYFMGNMQINIKYSMYQYGVKVIVRWGNKFMVMMVLGDIIIISTAQLNINLSKAIAHLCLNFYDISNGFKPWMLFSAACYW